MSAKQEKAPSAPIPAFNHLETLWSMEEREPSSFSLASRVALVSRAFMELPESAHLPWAARAAACLMDLDRIGDPYTPPSRQKPDPMNSHSNERSSMVSPLIAKIAERGELKTIAALFALLPPPSENRIGTDPATAASLLYKSSLERFVEAKKAPMIAKFIQRGALIQWHQIKTLFAREAAAMDHPLIAKALIQTIQREIKEDKKGMGGSKRSYIDRLDAEHMTCAHPAWLAAIVSGLQLDTPTRPTVDDLGLLINLARRANGQTQAWAIAQREALMKKNPRAARSINLAVFSEPQREAAKAAGLYFHSLRGPALQALAQRDPISAARAIVEWSTPKDLQSSWDASGLSTVDALSFVTRGNDSARFTQHSGHWPKLRWEAPGAATVSCAQGATLTALDCLALHAPLSPSIKTAAENGGAFSDGLPLLLKDKALFGRMELKESLWYESALANPTPKAPAARLRV